MSWREFTIEVQGVEISSSVAPFMRLSGDLTLAFDEQGNFTNGSTFARHGDLPSPIPLLPQNVKLLKGDDPNPHQFVIQWQENYTNYWLSRILPDDPAHPEAALRTWASQFEPDKTLHFADTPFTVNIVDAPVIPVPEAAYAVLRWQEVPTVDGRGVEQQVECIRFAWGPEASRIELVCADDLRTGIVRRRAVFQWRDAVRPFTLTGAQYAIQKITLTGSTHFPNTLSQGSHDQTTG